ncbi:hypothetical protein MPSEU_000869900 [Mayamaea pseudoterrestris]|nr:hypothetical protein MPSEU_000869900 [Mayamaea pseudoterrestris]
MLTAASTLAARSGARVVGDSMAAAASSPLLVLHPCVTNASRRFHQSLASSSYLHKNAMQLQRAHRWMQCKARLYARHLLTVAALHAATLKHRSALMERSLKPAEWSNWSRKEWSDELLKTLGSTKLARLWSATVRLGQLTLLAAPLLCMLPLSLVSQRATDYIWSYALWGIEQAGPTFVKLTQWATTRQDLFSPEFCSYFGKLRDETNGHSWKETLQILQSQPQLDYLEHVDINPTPIGSGCIAQVYKATLKHAVGQYPAGTALAIKVQHPHIWQKVCVDFYLFDKLSHLLESLPYLNLKYLSLTDTVRQFRDIMLPQLDLTLEMKHLQRFNRDFCNEEQVKFPKPIEQLTSELVLTETFISGKPIMEFTKDNVPFAVKNELAYLGLNTTLKMMFVHDFLHGDLHPGNILIGYNDRNKLVMNLLDCGLVVEVGPEQHVNMIKILGAFTRRNGRLAGQLMVDTSRDCQAGPEDVELFVQGIELICVEDEEHNFIECIGDYVADICMLACQKRVKLEASFINMALGIEIMEGIATKLNPDIQVAKVALPMVLQAEVMHRLPKFSLW